MTDEIPDLLPEDRPERSLIYRLALLSAAGIFFLLGVAFWLIPVLTGIPFHILALVCLGLASRRAARWINTRERRLPRRWRLLLRPKLRRELRDKP
ncbi:MAG: hypothetical protein ACT4PU_11705 [Planctomycetota bacterium]